MQLGGRLSAAIEVLDEIETRHRPASAALKDWGRAHRFAGSGDRAAIGNLVFDALRCKNSLQCLMRSDSSRAAVLGVAAHLWRLEQQQIAEAFAGKFGPGALSEEETSCCSATLGEDEPDWISGDYPQWLDDAFKTVFGEKSADQGRALAMRAPLDLRTNTLKTTPEKLLKAFAKFGAVQSRWLPGAIRIAPPKAGGRTPNVEVEPAHAKGWFEVQDTASQIVARLALANPGMQVADICAGAGGKTLALAAAMANKGQIHVYDNNKHRLRPIFERIGRAGVRNTQIIPADEPQRLEALAGRLDTIFIDAPCTGTGSWRRKPDAKWRLKPETLEQRCKDQQTVLATAANLARPGTRLVYVTCSVLPQENTQQVEKFLSQNPDFKPVPIAQIAQKAGLSGLVANNHPDPNSLLLTPLDHDTDGFFISIMEMI